MKCPKCVMGRLEQIESGLICGNCGYRQVTEGVVMTVSKKGTCPVCGRDNVTMVNAEKCWSCYDKKRKNRVKVDVAAPEVPAFDVPVVLPSVESPPPVIKPKIKGLDSLLPVARRGLSMPDELMSNLEEAGITALDVEFMLRLLLSGQLQRLS